MQVALLRMKLLTDHCVSSLQEAMCMSQTHMRYLCICLHPSHHPDSSAHLPVCHHGHTF